MGRCPRQDRLALCIGGRLDRLRAGALLELVQHIYNIIRSVMADGRRRPAADIPRHWLIRAFSSKPGARSLRASPQLTDDAASVGSEAASVGSVSEQRQARP